jgi:hypothetical protein
MKVLEILKKTEEELRESIAEAARAGDYRNVDIGRSVALNIKEIFERISQDGQILSRPIKEDAKAKNKKKRKKTYKRNKPEGLPRFEVQNGSLFKIGWSRKQQCEYSHKVPRAAFDAIVGAMAGLAKGGTGLFTAETIIEKLNTATGDMMPAYQVYVVVAVLRAFDLISQVGREGYNIPPDISEKAKNMWTELTGK